MNTMANRLLGFRVDGFPTDTPLCMNERNRVLWGLDMVLCGWSVCMSDLAIKRGSILLYSNILR